jgi:quinol monooxygenase YgiN
MKTGTLINIAFFKAREGGDRLEAELLNLVEPTRREPGCLQYDICRSATDPHDVVVFERWQTPSDFDAHMRTPYVGAFMGKVSDLCGQDVEIRAYHMVSEPKA